MCAITLPGSLASILQLIKIEEYLSANLVNIIAQDNSICAVVGYQAIVRLSARH